jgi:hypothetical protein
MGYNLRIINHGATKALVIAGSDARGTAYGVFDISEKIGVSPWYWRADVTKLKSFRKNRIELLAKHEEDLTELQVKLYCSFF